MAHVQAITAQLKTTATQPPEQKAAFPPPEQKTSFDKVGPLVLFIIKYMFLKSQLQQEDGLAFENSQCSHNHRKVRAGRDLRGHLVQPPA